jgi:hypothetical protein
VKEVQGCLALMPKRVGWEGALVLVFSATS